MKRPGALPKSRKRLTTSTKRRLEHRRRVELCKFVHRRDGETCKAQFAADDVKCWGPLDVHEIVPRARWREGYLVESNCLLVCRAHHDWIHTHPARATAAGLLAHRYEMDPRFAETMR